MDKLFSIIVTIIGILLLLPLISVDLGTTSDWLITIGVLVIGIKGLLAK
tara:strand:- start:1419 stop:1565 length:147 start_codon:yes stop_codon:yes gene_type:complete